MGTVVRIAAPRSAATPRRAKIIRPVQFRNVSGQAGHVPPLDRLLREGRASSRRIHDHESGIRRFRKAVLIEWLDQAERLWIAAETHKLKGKHFLVFATQIGIDRSSAYELIKLHPNRKQVVARCRKENQWPGWEVCAGWFKADGATDIDHELTGPNRGILTPTWQRFKVADIEYGTPQALFDHYDRVHHFTLDVCSTAPMAKCKHFYTPEQDGLKQVWRGVCWMNPPYTELGRWVKKPMKLRNKALLWWHCCRCLPTPYGFMIMRRTRPSICSRVGCNSPIAMRMATGHSPMGFSSFARSQHDRPNG